MVQERALPQEGVRLGRHVFKIVRNEEDLHASALGVADDDLIWVT